MSDLHGDRSKPAIVDTNALEWQASPSPGVWRKRLELIGDTEKGMVTSIVRFDPGSGFPLHDHPLGEEVLVLDGTFADEHDTYPAGTWTLLPANTPHSPQTEEGCTLLVKLCQYKGEGLPAFRKDVPFGEAWRVTDPGREQFDLYHVPGSGERTYIARLAPGTRSPHHVHDGGEEVFVLSGELRDENNIYSEGTWFRLPDGSSHQPWTDNGCTLYVKRGHLKAAA